MTKSDPRLHNRTATNMSEDSSKPAAPVTEEPLPWEESEAPAQTPKPDEAPRRPQAAAPQQPAPSPGAEAIAPGAEAIAPGARPRAATEPATPAKPAATTRTTPPRRAVSHPSPLAIGAVLLAVMLVVAGGGAYLWYTNRHDAALELAAQLRAQQRQLDELRQSVTQLSAAREQAEAEAATLRGELEAARNDFNGGLRQARDAFRNDFDLLSATLNELRDRRQSDNDTLLLAEIEYLLRLAGERLRLAGDIFTATTALEIARQRLQSASDPALGELRRLSGDALSRLYATPVFDRSRLAAALGKLAQQAAELPRMTIITAPPAAPVSAPVVTNENNEPPALPGNSGGWTAPAIAFAKRAWSDFGASFAELLEGVVRIQDVDAPPPAVLSPDQHYFLSGNLRLLLLGARQALLGSHYEATLQNLDECASLLSRYFDAADPGVRDLLRQLRAIHESVRTRPAYPPPDAALEEVRRLRTLRGER